MSFVFLLFKLKKITVIISPAVVSHHFDQNSIALI